MARHWWELRVLLPRKAATPIGVALMRLGATGTQEDHPPGFTPRFQQPWEQGPPPRRSKNVLLRAWFDAPLPPERLEAVLSGQALTEPEWVRCAEEDWAEGWKTHFQVQEIAENLVIAPIWDPRPGALLMEPGMAFGTGDHPTTRACLVAIAQLARPHARMLDVGCGSGILALAAAKLGMDAEGIDIDPDAVTSAQAAAQLNQLPVRFSTTPIEALTGTYELIAANLFAEVIVAMAPHLLRLSAGPIALAGILADRADTVRAALASRPCLTDHTEGDWTSLVYGPP